MLLALLLLGRGCLCYNSSAGNVPAYCRSPDCTVSPGNVTVQLGSTTSELVCRGMNIAPTLEVRPGYPFNVLVTQDIVFPGPYDDARQP